MSTAMHESIVLDFLKRFGEGLPGIADGSGVRPWTDDQAKSPAASAYKFEEQYRPIASILLDYWHALDAKDIQISKMEGGEEGQQMAQAQFRQECQFFSIMAGFYLVFWQRTKEENPNIGDLPEELHRAYQIVAGSPQDADEWHRAPELDAELRSAVEAQDEDLLRFPWEE
jgi:hypothetical protein